MYKPKIGITIGSINGIGPEIILKVLSEPKLLNMFTPVLFTSTQVLEYYQELLAIKPLPYAIVSLQKNVQLGKINIVPIWKESLDITPGSTSTDLDKYAALSIVESCKAIKGKMIDALVTAPIQKSSLIINGKTFVGHTDLFRTLFNAPNALMTMVSPQLRVALLTEHVPVKEVSTLISKHNLISTIRNFHTSLKNDFNILNPRLAVLGFNPHNGDNGLIGKEEKEIIIPTLKYIREEENILAFGPFSADGFWGFHQEGTFDGVLAMYHDQGLIPFKMKFGDIGVNFTAGLPFVRTSPDHGTALDIAGKNIANPDSMRHALFSAVDIVRNQLERKEMYANPLSKKKPLPKDDDK